MLTNKDQQTSQDYLSVKERFFFGKKQKMHHMTIPGIPLQLRH
jgi:hypothetical protein